MKNGEVYDIFEGKFFVNDQKNIWKKLKVIIKKCLNIK